MTSTPVTASYVTVNAADMMMKTQAGAKNGSSDFKTMMDQTKNSDTTGTAATDRKNTVKTAKTENDRDDAGNMKESEKTETAESPKETRNADADVQETDTRETVDEAKDIINGVEEKICETFDISKEELEDVLSTMGLTMLALLDTDTLPSIVTGITGNEDVISLATDETAYAGLMDITASAEEADAEMADLLNMDTDTLNEALKDLEVMPEENTTLPDAAEIIREPETVTEEGQETMQPVEARKAKTFEGKIEVNVQRDENPGNAEVKEIRTADKGTSEYKNDSSNMSFGQSILEKVEQLLNETASVEETTPYTSFDAENILNQLTESIKIDVTPENSEISMRLHPESLGTVNVKVTTNSAGTLTAQFTAQNEAVKSVIESQAAVLKESLEAKGVTVEAVEVLVQSHEFERNLSDQNRGQNGNGERRTRRAFRRIDINEEPAEDASDDDALVREMMAQNGNSVDYSA